MSLRKTIFFLTGIFVFGLALGSSTFAQGTSNFIYLDWHSSSYAPAEYLNLARPLSAAGSKIEFTANLFSVQEKTVGKNKVPSYQALDPENYRLSWSVNSKKLAEGQGMNRFVYELPRGVTLGRLLVEVSAFNTEETEPLITKEISLPLAKEPLVTVHQVVNQKVLPLTQTAFSAAPGETLTLYAKPYFFSAPGLLDLSFAWYKGKQQLDTETGQSFSVQLPSFASSGSFTAVIFNTRFSLELGQQELRIESK